jgi:hypothetical protein
MPYRAVDTHSSREGERNVSFSPDLQIDPENQQTQHNPGTTSSQNNPGNTGKDSNLNGDNSNGNVNNDNEQNEEHVNDTQIKKPSPGREPLPAHDPTLLALASDKDITVDSSGEFDLTYGEILTHPQTYVLTLFFTTILTPGWGIKLGSLAILRIMFHAR